MSVAYNQLNGWGYVQIIKLSTARTTKQTDLATFSFSPILSFDIDGSTLYFLMVDHCIKEFRIYSALRTVLLM